MRPAPRKWRVRSKGTGAAFGKPAGGENGNRFQKNARQGKTETG
jgi:hypothetical protein